MAACSSARSAYIRLSLACSASSSRSCRTSDTDAPPYLLRHLKNVALLTPCVRHRSGTGTPLSASRRMPTIWVSLNLDFRMTAPWTRAVYVQLSIDRGSLRCFYPHTDLATGTRMTGHAVAAEAGIPTIYRRLYHNPNGYQQEHQFDFVNYFECADEHLATFDQVCRALRDQRQNPEWRFVLEGPEWRGRRVLRW